MAVTNMPAKVYHPNRVENQCVSIDITQSHALVDEVTVTVHKPQAPITVPFADAAVTIVRARGER
jgi:dihydroneopterin aldolase